MDYRAPVWMLCLAGWLLVWKRPVPLGTSAWSVQLPHLHTAPGLMWQVDLRGAGGDIALQDTVNR